MVAVVWAPCPSAGISAQSPTELCAGVAGVSNRAPWCAPPRALRGLAAGAGGWCKCLVQLAADEGGTVQYDCRNAPAQPLYGRDGAAQQRPLYPGDCGTMATQLAPEPMSKINRH